MNLDTLTIADVEKMRAIVHTHDQQNQGGIKEFDLAHPPTPPYRYQEFPRLMYNHGTQKTKSANSADQVAQLEAAGWTKDPFQAEIEEPQLSAADAAEAAEIDSKLVKRPRRAA